MSAAAYQPEPDVQPVDLLSAFIAQALPAISDRSAATRIRVRMLWACAVAAHARNLAATDVIAADLLQLAIDAGLISGRGYWLPTDVREDVRWHGREDVEHVINWAMRGLNPFD